MNKNMKKMVLMQLVYSIFKSFVLIFVNIYLWKAGKSIKAVAIFNIFNYIAAFVAFYIGNKIALKSTRLNYLLSSTFFILLFALTAILGDEISRYSVLIGILGGFGDGLFFFNMNVFEASELERDEIDSFMSAVGIVGKLSSIITPVISGIVIEKFGFIYAVYMLILLLVVQMANALTLPNTKIKYLAKINIKKILSHKDYKKVLATHLIHTPFGQFLIMANSVFLYSFAKSESLMGFLNSAFAISSMLLFYIYMRAQKKYPREKLMFAGSLALALSVSLLFNPSFFSFVLFSLTISVGDAFFNKPLTGIQVYTAKKYGESHEELLGNLVFRVSLLTISRTIFYLLIFFFYVDNSSTIFRLLIIYNIASPILSYILCHKEMQ